MLELLFRNFVWASYWPLSVWLLMAEKSLKQAHAAEHQAEKREESREHRPQEERGMASDTFIKPEIPDSVRELVKISIEQTKRAFDLFASSSEKAWKAFEGSSGAAGASLAALNAKIAEITRSNAEANFALAMKLAESRDLNQAMELQSQHATKQMEAFSRQLEEVRELATRLVQDASPVSASPRSASATSSAFSASNDAGNRSSSFTPRGPSSSSSW